MKFSSKLDAQTFLSEIKAFDKISVADKDYIPTVDEMQSFLKVRTPLVKKLKNYRKSANQKSNWRKNRFKMMKGIKAFHRSTTGKRFHKRLARFMATRITRTKSNNESVMDSLMLKQGYLKGLASAKSHLLVELEYFHQAMEQIELEEFMIDYAFPYFRVIEERIIDESDLSPDELAFLFDITEEGVTIQKLSEITGQEFAQTEKVWNSIKDDLISKEIEESNEDYYSHFSNALHTQLGTKNDKT